MTMVTAFLVNKFSDVEVDFDQDCHKKLQLGANLLKAKCKLRNARKAFVVSRFFFYSNKNLSTFENHVKNAHFGGPKRENPCFDHF